MVALIGVGHNILSSGCRPDSSLFWKQMTRRRAKNRGRELATQRRVYPLDAHELTEEQIAVAFAMTSRRPEPFDEIARQVSQEKAADFHERWVLGYGHASVAEHAVVHLAVENVSRVAADTLEDNRLASYTEKSSRYQVLPPGAYHIPRELDARPDLRSSFQSACNGLFTAYEKCIRQCLEYLRRLQLRQANEREAAYALRLRRIATDSCRALLPAATLTNLGVTANARLLEHAITKLLSSELAEERELGEDIKGQARRITPTLIKYAEPNEYLRYTRKRQQELSSGLEGPAQPFQGQVRLVQWEPQAEARLAAALLYRASALGYEEIWSKVLDMTPEQRQEIIGSCLERLGDHDAPVRELELVEYLLEFTLDYGAYREFKRHRMQSYLPQALTIAHGHHTPQLLVDAGAEAGFAEGVSQAEEAFQRIELASPAAAQYLVTHAHFRRVLSKINLRECYHLFKLRISSQAHESIRGPMQAALDALQQVHPALFRHLKLRG